MKNQNIFLLYSVEMIESLLVKVSERYSTRRLFSHLIVA